MHLRIKIGASGPDLMESDGSDDVQVLVLFAALSTCDPGNILDTVKSAQQHKCRVSVVGLAAEVHICRLCAQVCLPVCLARSERFSGQAVVLWQPLKSYQVHMVDHSTPHALAMLYSAKSG